MKNPNMRTEKERRASASTLQTAAVSSSSAPAVAAQPSAPALLQQKKASFAIWTLVSIAILVLLAIAGWFYLDAEDRANSLYVPVGVMLNGTSLAGMNRAEVAEVVEGIVDSHLTQIITIYAGEAIVPFDVGSYVSTDPDKLTNEIMAVRPNTPVWDRLRHDYLDTPIPATFETGYLIDVEAIQGLAASIAFNFSTLPENAVLYFEGYTPHIIDEKTGIQIHDEPTAETIERAILDILNGKDTTHIIASSELLFPEVSREDLMVPVLTASINQRRVMLWNGDELVKTYPCAVGRPAYPTIPGEYYIGLKEINPPWYNPDPTGWGADSPQFLPGPNDALGLRGLHIYSLAGYNTLMLFHGALAGDKAGTATTHGCLRMFNSDVVDLYDRVPIGTRVSIAY